MLLNDCTESADGFATDINEDMPKPLDVVCFGLLTPMRVGIVEEYPKADSGALILSFIELILCGCTNHLSHPR